MTEGKSYILGATDFQNASTALEMCRREVMRLDIETVDQFAKRVEQVITAMEDGWRAKYDDPHFKTVVVHGGCLATITVEVLHGEKIETEGNGNDHEQD